jgi:hypothetical protein
MKYILLLCFVLIGGMACHKSGTATTSGISESTNYDSITLVGTNPFTNSQLQPQVAISSGNQMLFAIAETPTSVSDSVFIRGAGLQPLVNGRSAGLWNLPSIPEGRFRPETWSVFGLRCAERRSAISLLQWACKMVNPPPLTTIN